MSPAEIIGRDGECHEHRRRNDFWCEATCADRSLRTQRCADDNDRSHSDSTDPREEKSMSSKTKIAVIAVLLVASVAPVGAYAQSHDGAAVVPGNARHLKARVPANAQGSVAIPDASPAIRSGGRWLERDPDPRIRFEMNRDDRDRRAN
jgi:hypothetical protein